jgi:TetR/AcrR family transcriptional regulator, cholesterol catabolism regulator
VAEPALGATTAPAVVENETSAQRARRDRILQATLALASRGGYDAVQMREVAERSGVALGTLYRYFPSKVHLLVSAMGSELETMRRRMQRRAIPGRTRRERVSFVLEKSTRNLQRDPNLTDAMVRAMMAADASMAAEVAAVRSQMNDLIIQAMQADGVSTPDDEGYAGILQDVWFARQIAWLGGRISTTDVWRDIEAALHLVLRDEPARS